MKQPQCECEYDDCRGECTLGTDLALSAIEAYTREAGR